MQITENFQIFDYDEMVKNIKLLYDKFIDIKKMGWILSEKKGLGSIGYTFENLLGKGADSFFLPDYNGIEIKTRHYSSKQSITLFCLNPDGEYLFPVEYLKNTYGYPDKDMVDKKVLNFDVANCQNSHMNNNIFKIKVDYKYEKVFLEVKNLKTGSTDNSISWSFQSIKERLYIKLSYLSIVTASSKVIHGDKYLHYNDIRFYKLKGFEAFLKLLENGKICVKFKIGIFKSGRRIGETNNHGIGFNININDILLLFNKMSI